MAKNRYCFFFEGRPTRSIGKFYSYSHTFYADTLKEAIVMLYKEFEHIRMRKVLKNGKQMSLDEYWSATG